MKVNLLPTLPGLPGAGRVHSSTLWLLLLSMLAAGLPAAAQPGGFFLPSTLYASEPNSLTVIVQRHGGPELPAASVELVTADGTAKAGPDYTAVKSTLLFAAGQTQQWVTIPITDDTVIEGVESFTVMLRNPTGGTPLDPEHSATVVIQDDDRGFTLGMFWAGVLEDSGGAALYVRRSGANLPAATVELVTADGTAKAGLDYTAVTTNLTFLAGQTQQYVPIPLLNDALVEGEETLTVVLQNPVGFPLDPKDTTLTVRILDNDRGFVVRWADPAFHGYVRESESTAHFEVALVGDFALTEEASVTVSTEDGTAKAGADYKTTSARLVFAPGERVKSFTVPVLNDALAEGDETFFVTLSQSVGAPISNLAYESKLSATIVDNELGYRLDDPAAGRGWYPLILREGETASVTVWRDGDFDITSSVQLSFASQIDAFGEKGTATVGVDFPSNNLVVTFGPGETRKTVTFDLQSDGVDEPEENFFLALEAVGDAVPVWGWFARGYILDASVLPALVDPDFDLTTPLPADYDYFFPNTQKLAVMSDGRMIYAADRSGYDGQSGSVILRVLPDGRPDPTWQTATTPEPVSAIALTRDSELVIAQDADGNNQLLRLHADGSRDVAFKPVTDGRAIQFLVAYSDGRVLTAGYFSSVQRFLANGQPDSTFTPFPVEYITAIQRDAAGNVLVATPGPWGLLTRLKPDGTPDPGFKSPSDPVGGEAYSSYQSMLPLADGKLLILANIPSQGSVLTRLLPDGTVDAAFTPLPVGDQPRLVPGRDGALWLLRSGSNPALLVCFLERLLADGTRDPDWGSPQLLSRSRVRQSKGDTGPPAESPRLVPLPDGDLLVIDSQILNGHPRHRAAKIHPTTGLRVVVDPATARVPENAGNAAVRLLRSGPIANALTLGWGTEPITAVAGSDYTPMSSTVTFPAGHRDAMITAPVLDNDQLDRDRLVRLRFTAAPGAPVPLPTGFAIANDDLGFPPDGIRALPDGRVLLRPTGWLEERGWLQVEMGLLEELRSGNPGVKTPYREPFPELIQDAESYGNSVFFRVGKTKPEP